MNNKRPVNLNLMTIKFPITAISSILHRISGVFLFLLIPFVLYSLQQSLVSEQAFQELGKWLQAPLLRFVFWLFLSALVYHLIAGVRHLLMDVHVGESKCGGKFGAYLVIVVSVIFSITLGFLLW